MISTADEALEIKFASGVTLSVLTFQIWTAKVSAGRMGFKKLVAEKIFQLL